MTQPRLDTFTRAYIDAALWSSTAYGSREEEEQDPADANGDRSGRFDASFHDCNFGAADLSPELRAHVIADCTAFQSAHAEDIAADLAQAGHDFWLTRNGHGAGFWDGDWPQDVGKRLTDAAHAYGEEDWYAYSEDGGETYVIGKW